MPGGIRDRGEWALDQIVVVICWLVERAYHAVRIGQQSRVFGWEKRGHFTTYRDNEIGEGREDGGCISICSENEGRSGNSATRSVYCVSAAGRLASIARR